MEKFSVAEVSQSAAFFNLCINRAMSNLANINWPNEPCRGQYCENIPAYIIGHTQISKVAFPTQKIQFLLLPYRIASTILVYPVNKRCLKVNCQGLKITV